jgi:hypothetical protein
MTEAPDNSMTDEDIVAHLRSQADSARHFYNTELADRQENALDFYDSQPFGDEEDGRSQYIEPVVEQTVDDMAVDIMEAFVSGDRVVELEGNDEASEQAAMEATETLHYLFMRKQNGYRITLDWLQSGLVETIGFLKVACIEEKKRVKNQGIVPEDVLATLDMETVTAAQDNGDGTFTVEIASDTMIKKFLCMPVPSEEMLTSPRMKSMDDKVYKAHMGRKSLSDLIEMGFPRDVVENLPLEQGEVIGDVRENARWRDQQWQDKELKGNSREVLLFEEYDYIDIDGDGIVELVRAYRVDDVLLSVEPWPEQPFVAWCPYPRAHRLIGKGLAEKVMPDQRVESVITRQMLDGLYASNAPRRWLPEESIGETTIDDLLNVRPNAIIRGRGLTAPANLSENFDLSKSLTVLQRFSDRRQNRTGLTDLGRGMDKNAMNDTATGQAQLMAAGEKQIRYVARNFGEAMAEMFMKLMRLVRAHGEQMTIKIGKKYQPINPQAWPEEMDFSIRVGLGTNGKDKRIAYRMQVLELQAQAKAMGSDLVSDENLFNSMDGLIRDMGLGEPSDYVVDPNAPPEIDPETGEPKVKEEKPDPEMVKVQAEQQMAQAKMQAEQEAAQAKLQMDAQRHEADIAMAQQKLEVARQEGELKIMFAKQQADQKQQLERERAIFEAELAREQADREYALAMQNAQREGELANLRAGGELNK